MLRDSEAKTTRHEAAPDEATAARGGPESGPILENDDTLYEDTASEHESLPEVLRDRYELGQVLGRGGLGVVVEAWDRELERTVAIKLVRPSARTGPSRTRAADRMVLEAQALAQLSAPNVVAVFDVGKYRGRDEDGVFVVMELLEGPSLTEWLRGPRTAREILEVFRRAGEGLAAAHERSLVHRDFKPANVVLDALGEPKVVDFGLALTAATPVTVGGELDDASLDEDASGPALLLRRVTQTGFVMGTPRYMAPEQHQGEEIGPAADQYAFCNALWEALRGRPLFPQPTMKQLAVAKRRRMIPAAPLDDRTPPALEPVLRRGLEPDPGARWPSMRALLRALDPAPAKARRRGLLLVAGLGAAAVLAAAWGIGHDQSCEAPEGPFTTQARHALEERLEDAGAPERLSAAIISRASRHATALRDGFVAACEAHREGELGDAALDRRTICLRQSSQLFEDSLGIVIETSSMPPDRMLDVLVGLGSAHECEDDQRLAEQFPLPSDPQEAAEVEALRNDMGRVESLGLAGRSEEATELFESMQRRADALGYEPVVVELLWLEARRDTSANRYDEAEATLEETLERAQRIGYDRISAQAAISLVFVLGVGQSRFDDALRMASTAEALVQRAGEPPLLAARLHSAIGTVHSQQHRFDDAIERFESALSIAEATPEIDRGEMTVFLGNLAIALRRKGDLEAAAAKQREALAIREEILTSDHPRVGYAVMNLANTLSKQGKREEAEALYLRAIDIFDRGDPPSPGLAYPLIGLGVLYKKQARYDEAAPLYERAASLAEEAHGPSNSLVTQAQQNLANLEKRRGNVERARELSEQAVRGLRTRLDDGHPELAVAITDLGDIYLRLDEHERAEKAYREAVEMLEGAQGGADTLGAARIGLGRVALAAERWDEAREHFERARATVVAADEAAYAELGLGRLEQRLGNVEPAIEHFRAALAVLADEPDASAGAQEARDALAELGAQ